jgi:AcrR family transcriptional regulator
MIGRPACTAAATPRAEAQRERILCAAQKCFIENGFHAASMANIAAAAQMSAGLMYRYFENKNAIVLAIIERQLQQARAQIARLRTSADLVADILDTFERWRSRDPAFGNAALFLETNAASTRDPLIAAALHATNAAIRDDLKSWMRRSRDEGGLGLPDTIVDSRVVLLQCLIEGLAVRAIREPEVEVATLRQAVTNLVNGLLSPECHS